MGRFWAWLATRAASFYILGTMSVLLSGSVWYVQQLRVRAAECEGRQEAYEVVGRLTERLARDIDRRAGETIEDIEDTVDDCLDAAGPESARKFLRDNK